MLCSACFLTLDTLPSRTASTDPGDAGQTGAGKLKDLGNSLLGNFGMSLDNFKAVKDPASGSYSISFQQ